MADDQVDHSDLSDSDQDEDSSLQDYIESSVMLQYNTRKEWTCIFC